MKTTITMENVPIITNYSFENVVARGILSHLEESVPGVEPFLVKLDDMAAAFISANSVAVVLMIDEMEDDQKELFKEINSQVEKYKTPVLVMARKSEKSIFKELLPSAEIVFCGSIDDVKQFKQTVGLYLSRYGHYEKKTILLVDDSGEVLRNVKSWFDKKYFVVMAKSGEMALRYMTKKIPDLILLDYEMPGMNGREVFQALKKDVSTADIPVFFLTGKNDKDIVLKIMAVHPEGYILKTESRENVLERIENFFASQKKK